MHDFQLLHEMYNAMCLTSDNSIMYQLRIVNFLESEIWNLELEVYA